ncbi:helix-turn-helix domain-containing protein [Bradyrhizobium pachyrhizi]|uniref:helix-turn-helix domain-containing protein n=1 Tax=Bradyrhizobium pachyrhizi TaxID=280333 RepID=UPI0012E3D90A|nr:helix-turn-helix transcriptional regulator [Bradyrhizobium pachyrhizi]
MEFQLSTVFGGIDRKTESKLTMAANRLTGTHARAARGILAWSVRHLAEQSGISESSIKRIEATPGNPEVSLDLLDKLQRFYEGRGFKFVHNEADGYGVYWRSSERRRGGDRRGSGGLQRAE